MWTVMLLCEDSEHAQMISPSLCPPHTCTCREPRDRRCPLKKQQWQTASCEHSVFNLNSVFNLEWTYLYNVFWHVSVIHVKHSKNEIVWEHRPPEMDTTGLAFSSWVWTRDVELERQEEFKEIHVSQRNLNSPAQAIIKINYSYVPSYSPLLSFYLMEWKKYIHHHSIGLTHETRAELILCKSSLKS